MLFFKCILFAVLALIFFLYGMHGIKRYYAKKVQQEKMNQKRVGTRRKDRSSAKLKRAFVGLVVLPSICATAFSSAWAVNLIRYGDECRASGKQLLSLKPDNQTTGDLGGGDFVTSPPASDTQMIFEEFYLSEVKDSEMLEFDQNLLDGADISAEQLEEAAGNLVTYMERLSNPPSFFSYYPNLATEFPRGKEIDNSFEFADTVEKCNAQLRGAGGRLEKLRETCEQKEIAKMCHRLAIRSGDAMFYTKRDGGAQKDRLIWLYAEIGFASSINEFVYDRPEGVLRPNWYYRTAQIFDYLGGITEDENLKLRMYFTSAVFLENAFKTWEEIEFKIIKDCCDVNIGYLYIDMLYRVAVRMDSTEQGGFYQKIKQVGDRLGKVPLYQKGITNRLNSLDGYQRWRERNG